MTESKFKAFTSAELSNDEYHDPESWCAEYVSGSGLAKIYASCPAAWKFEARNQSRALVFGTQAHTNFESAELFAKTYRRSVPASEIKDVLTSQTAVSAKLKSFGIPGTSGKQWPELLKMYADCGEDLNILYLIGLIEQSEAWAEGRELVRAEDYDACVAMRSVLEAIPKHAECMNSPTAQRELSLFGEVHGVKVKVRIDHVDVIENYEIDSVLYPEVVVITDYKSTQSANPSEFDRLAYNHGYYLKMALQRDLFVKTYNEKRPVVVRLLAQEKKEPFLPIAFVMQDEQLKIGRIQYGSVIHQYRVCVENDVWPSYENGEPEVKLPTPEWVKRLYPQVFETK
ncbi:PD-(D/E)XK nuclease-like domain-containing protein [Gibbsiella quercinecans]|uniref:PD-(D/E)XK nuclease-like domain-containing protein n=1 Tax=Gibbsiella quercinecans TaxID=929813 RepID=UPI00242EEB27|nr:PD-(D/E)XK nuclease-like domain-containing protein [Gibbsiella quercinecans]